MATNNEQENPTGGPNPSTPQRLSRALVNRPGTLQVPSPPASSPIQPRTSGHVAHHASEPELPNPNDSETSDVQLWDLPRSAPPSEQLHKVYRREADKNRPQWRQDELPTLQPLFENAQVPQTFVDCIITGMQKDNSLLVDAPDTLAQKIIHKWEDHCRFDPDPASTEKPLSRSECIDAATKRWKYFVDQHVEVSGIKPQTGQDYADVTFIQIPGSEYSLRFWPGSFHWAEYCVDFVDAITGKPMNVPQKYEIWKIPDPEDKPWLVSVVAKMESIEKLYGINDPLPGEEKFILRDGMACQLALRVKKGEVDSEDNVKSVPLFRFRVPKHVPERSRAADVRSIPSESDSGSSDEYDNDADTSSSGEGSSCSGEDSNDELYPELGEATGYRDNIMRTPQAWRFTQQ
ncbi:hypothetical protein ONZ51_g2518 [Trametes cubensis]|uniref:Uncharacterized protein n=1 Tax=Trametes cubensis TaxID=1111947 RepID=A0AAD7TZL3_9APHY|nr:hypothetical protein ONZ51_g2518 [Trametes cubensis]